MHLLDIPSFTVGPLGRNLQFPFWVLDFAVGGESRSSIPWLGEPGAELEGTSPSVSLVPSEDNSHSRYRNEVRCFVSCTAGENHSSLASLTFLCTWACLFVLPGCDCAWPLLSWGVLPRARLMIIFWRWSDRWDGNQRGIF